MTARRNTPTRAVLSEKSTLRPLVQDGLGAVKKVDKCCVAEAIRTEFVDSIDIDEALRPGNEQMNRWDYLLGHSPSGRVVAVEPHSAKDDEVSAVIAKRVAARQQLQAHLRPGATIACWLWVASNKVRFADTEKARRRLDQNGIQFAGRQVESWHLPNAASAAKLGRRK